MVRFTASLSGALDRLAEVPLWSMTPEEEREALVELHKQQARLEELELRLLVQADRDGVGADSGATSTPAWLAHATKTTTAGRHRDLHLGKKLDETFHATKAALAAGLIDVEKAGIVTAAVEALTAEYDDLPRRRSRAKAEAHMVDQAKEFDAPTLKQLGKRLFEVVCPEAADAAEGKKLEKEEAKARALAHFSVRDHGDGTATGLVQAAHPARRPAEEGPRGTHQPAPDRRRQARPGDREEAAARDAARAGVDGAGREPPLRPAERERVPVHPGRHPRHRRPDVRDRGRHRRHRAPDLRRRSPAAGVQGRDHP